MNRRAMTQDGSPIRMTPSPARVFVNAPRASLESVDARVLREPRVPCDEDEVAVTHRDPRLSSPVCHHRHFRSCRCPTPDSQDTRVAIQRRPVRPPAAAASVRLPLTIPDEEIVHQIVRCRKESQRDRILAVGRDISTDDYSTRRAMIEHRLLKRALNVIGTHRWSVDPRLGERPLARRSQLIDRTLDLLEPSA